MGKRVERKYIVYAIIFIIVILISGIRIYFEEEGTGILSEDCMINYGYGKCVNSMLTIPFYNDNDYEITNIKITIPLGIKADIALPADFNINLPLSPHRTEAVELISCDNKIDTSSFKLEWCCGQNCYKTRMTQPDSKLTIE